MLLAATIAMVSGPAAAETPASAVARARDADIAQSALFFEFDLVAHRPEVREDAFLQPGQEDHRELQAFGVVQRHQGHGVFGHVTVLALHAPVVHA